MLLNKKDVNEALRLLSGDAELYVPGEVGGVSRFVLWSNGELEPEYSNTLLPPKDILFPNTEKMYSFKTSADPEISEAAENRRQIIFGIRPCDVSAIDCMDRVFLEKTFVDSFYARKRENTTLIAMACAAPGEFCFCDSMGLNPNTAPEADMLLIDMGDKFGIEAHTEKGKAIAKLWDGLITKGKAKHGDAACTLKTNMSKKIPEKLAGMFEHEIWEDAGKACIGCATCTYACPTCYCFDIGIDSHGNEGVAFRCWDSCMFSEYSRMAGGHNPRPTKKERVRNRYMHKLSYFNERYGKTLCVGCGRCVYKCPANLDITEFIDKVAEVSL